MNNDDMKKLVESTRRRPKVIHKHSEILESETLENAREVKTVDDKQYVVETRVVTITTRLTVVRLLT